MNNSEIFSIAMQILEERKPEIAEYADSMEQKALANSNEKRKARRMEEVAVIRDCLNVEVGSSVNKLAMSYASRLAGSVLQKGQPPAERSMIIDFLKALKGISNSPFDGNMLSEQVSF